MKLVMSRERKAQITAFMLLALVILVIFLFMFYVRDQIQRQRMEGKIDVMADVLQKTPALNYYVTLCLKESAENALLLAGKQGGNIYLEQDGMIDRASAPIFRYKDDNVTYGLTSADSAVQNSIPIIGLPSYPSPPGYPCIKTDPPISYKCVYDSLFRDDPLPTASFYPFSSAHLPLLCMPNGPNDVSAGIYPFPCPSGSYGQYSIQEQIKYHAERRMPNCTNFSIIKQMVGLNITAGSPVITPIIGEDDIIMKATYPINITIDGYGSLRLFEFEAKIPVRLKKIYGLARFLADNDKAYIDFNITKDFNSEEYSNPYWDPYMRIEKFCPLCNPESPGIEADTTDILQINDSASSMRGSDYYFRFAIENRIPALDRIHNTQPDEAFDYIVQEGDEVVIDPIGYDPDDNDDMYYRYEGWKQTYDEVFDPGCCLEINPSASVSCRQEPWRCVKDAPATGLQLCMEDYTQEDITEWTTSSLYLPSAANLFDTYRNAAYTTKTTDPSRIASNPSSEDTNPVYYPCVRDETIGEFEGTPYSRDLGPHNVTVKVCDRHEKCDWQSVLIMVSDIPKPVIKTSNYYGTADASLEDPYTLDASRSSIFAVIDSYRWRSAVPGSGMPDFDFTVSYSETQNGAIRIPHPISGYDIMSIKDDGNQEGQPQNFFKQSGEQTLSLILGSQTQTEDIDVKECIPRSGTGSPSYPYNTVTDPFMADHACCESGGTYSTASKECYNSIRYGGIMYLGIGTSAYSDPTLSNYPIFWHLGSATTQTAPSDISANGNDVFLSRFGRHCSGARGNTCTGTAQEDRTISHACNDWGYDWQDERCQGPVEGVKLTSSDAYCMNYPAGQTFESEEGVQISPTIRSSIVNFYGTQYGSQLATMLGAANGFCSDVPRCTNGVNYAVQGPFYCQKAVCDGIGHCTKPYTTGAQKCMCGQACGADARCSAFSYDDLKNGGMCLPDGSGFCTAQCIFHEPDQSQAACACSDNEWNAGIASDIEISVNGNTLCCGDDPAERYLANPFDPSDDACCDNKNSNGALLGGTECVLNGRCMDTKVQQEICDGKDNDCDGAVDEGILNAPRCGNLGVCLSSYKPCVGGAELECTPANTPDMEFTEITCNDAKDNDCDGWDDCVDDDCDGMPACS